MSASVFAANEDQQARIRSLEKRVATLEVRISALSDLSKSNGEAASRALVQTGYNRAFIARTATNLTVLDAVFNNQHRITEKNIVKLDALETELRKCVRLALFAKDDAFIEELFSNEKGCISKFRSEFFKTIEGVE